MAAVFTDMAAVGLTTASICIDIGTSPGTFTCPGGFYNENVSVPAGFHVNVTTEDSVCWQGDPATSGTPVWSFDGSSGNLMGFEAIECQTGDVGALYVRDGQLDLFGLGPDADATKVSCNASTGASAAMVDELGLLHSRVVSYQETTIGVSVRGSFGHMSGGGVGRFVSERDEIEMNDLGVEVLALGEASLFRSSILNNEAVMLVTRGGDLLARDTRFSGNTHPTCGTGSWTTPSLPSWWLSSRVPNGAIIEGSSTVELANTRWTGNCTNYLAQTALVSVHDTAHLTMYNATFDANETQDLVRLSGSATADVFDTILADDGNLYGMHTTTPFIDTGVRCSSTGLVNVNHVAFWNLDQDIAGGCSVGAGILTGAAADPSFTSVSFTDPLTGALVTRNDHLSQSPVSGLVDQGSRAASAAFVPVASYGTFPNPPATWVADSGAVDLGWHWWD